jgi:CRISPR-associated protein Cas2
MVVLTVIDCPVGLRGDLTKWLLEISTGVFVGRVSARVRDNLWERVKEFSKNGRATMVYSTNNEQRLDFRVHNSQWEPIDFDGLKLILRPSPSRTKKLSKLRQGYSKASQYQHIKSRTHSKKVITNEQISRCDLERAIYPSSYVIVDIETTGLSPDKNEIIEIGAVKVKNHDVIETFNMLIKSTVPVSPMIEKLTGISNQLLKAEGKEPSHVLLQFNTFIEDYPLIAHNSNFDKGFLDQAHIKHLLDPINNVWIDTLTLAKQNVHNIKSYSLKALAEHLGIEFETSHRGISDCLATKSLYEKLIKMI